jgi:alpha-amylase
MRKILTGFACAALLASIVQAGDTNGWKQRTVYQILTDRFAVGGGSTPSCNLHNYCGGNYDGIGEHLQYVKDLGFDAIWISPIVDNLDGGYHGYWAKNWEKVNNHFGDEDSLKRLVKKAHSMGIWVMVDVVANHVAPIESDFSQIYPLNKAEHYHKDCDINDWNNQW